MEEYRRYLPEADGFWSLPEPWVRRVLEAFSGEGSRVGGYPYFTQYDPREHSAALAGHTVLLFQCDSEFKIKNQVIWGDAGVAGFFIEPERLAALDFSRVAYSWDCH